MRNTFMNLSKARSLSAKRKGGRAVLNITKKGYRLSLSERYANVGRSVLARHKAAFLELAK